MRIVRQKKGECKDNIVFVNREEAIRIIKSLSHQMMAQNPNTGREEFQTENGEYFTMAVTKK